MNLARTTLTIPQNILDSARIKAASQRKSLSKLVSELIAERLKLALPASYSYEEKMKTLGTISVDKKGFKFPSRAELYKDRGRI